MAQLVYKFVTIPAINTCSDPQILEGGSFVSSITGVETGSATDKSFRGSLYTDFWLACHTDLKTVFQQDSDGIPQDLFRQNSCSAILTEFLWSSSGHPVQEVMRSTPQPWSSKRTLQGNGLEEDVRRNSPVISQVVHSS